MDLCYTRQMSAKRWEFFDQYDEFYLGIAIFLWCDEYPPDDVLELGNAIVNYMDLETKLVYEEILEVASLLKRQSFAKGVILRDSDKQASPKDKISRKTLLKIASILNKRPPLLFPEERACEKAFVKGAAVKDENSLDPRKETTYLKLIYSLLQSQKIDPQQRGSASRVQRIIEQAGLKLSEQTIRKILKIELNKINPENK